MEKGNAMSDYEIHVITLFKGPNEWLQECIDSVKNQTVSSIHHITVDHENKGAARNHFEALQKINPNKTNIVIHLDGDDKLIDAKAFETILNVYRENENIWATYGNYISDAGSVCRPIDWRGFRESIVNGGWCYSHLRTFRASLIPYIKDTDMKDSAGNWLTSTADAAIFCPILELCGKDRVAFLNRPFMYYRLHHNNDHSTPEKLKEQIRCALEVVRKPCNQRIGEII